MADQPPDADAPCRLIEAGRLTVVHHEEELVGRCQPGVERFPLQQVAGDCGTGFGGG